MSQLETLLLNYIMDPTGSMPSVSSEKTERKYQQTTIQNREQRDRSGPSYIMPESTESISHFHNTDICDTLNNPLVNDILRSGRLPQAYVNKVFLTAFASILARERALRREIRTTIQQLLDKLEIEDIDLSFL